MAFKVDGTNYADWIGQTEDREDDIWAGAARAAAATLDSQEIPTTNGSPLPPLWHWFYFLPTVPQSSLDADGHPKRGGFMPPIALPRRMFAGARTHFIKPLTIGKAATRHGTIRDVKLKSGKSGSLAFVTVGYVFRQEGEVCIEEEQDIVYREPGKAVAAPVAVPFPSVDPGVWERSVTPDARLLFRFSALTFNAHRIHYDRPYARDEEGYPGLVVHGPLTAILLADLVRRHSPRPIRNFEFRGRGPLFDLAPFRLIGRTAGEAIALEAQGPDGQVALTATANLEPAT